MGKPTGFIEWPRRGPPKRDKTVRLGDWQEVYRAPAAEDLARQGGRCMDCGVPFCTQGCPLGNHIPDWNDLVYRDRWQAAFRRLAATNNFPEFTGRLCPAPCEAACVLAINSDAVTIEEIEKQIVEHAFREGWVRPQPPRARTGFEVAVVGSGPAGLAAAAQLNAAGHQVTVYEADDRAGGMLRYGIPDFKMEKWVLDRRLEILRAEGIAFQTGVRVGDAVGWDELRNRHDALVIAVGAQKPHDLPIPGRDLRGVHFAMEYLTQQNRVGAGDDVPAGRRIDAAGTRVVILGGGDTGSDCLGTALRQGATSVRQIELIAEPPGQRAADNPWPEWPVIFRVSSSQEEGGERDFAVMTKRLLGDGGALVAAEAVRVERRDEDGQIRLVELPGTAFRIPCELLLVAIGFSGPVLAGLSEQLGVETDRRGVVRVDDRYATSVDGVFCAGDAMNGASLIVWAIAHGREAARHVDSYLRGGAAPWLPTRGIDARF